MTKSVDYFLREIEADGWTRTAPGNGQKKSPLRGSCGLAGDGLLCDPDALRDDVWTAAYWHVNSRTDLGCVSRLAGVGESSQGAARESARDHVSHDRID